MLHRHKISNQSFNQKFINVTQCRNEVPKFGATRFYFYAASCCFFLSSGNILPLLKLIYDFGSISDSMVCGFSFTYDAKLLAAAMER